VPDQILTFIAVGHSSSSRFAETIGFDGLAIEPAPVLGPPTRELTGYLGGIVDLDEEIRYTVARFAPGGANGNGKGKTRKARMRRARAQNG